MGLLSALAGIAVGLAMLWAMNFTEITFVFGQMDITLQPGIPVSEIFWVTFIVMLVSLFAGFQPAYKASKMEPVVALGHQ